jgi:hypothetical protein
MNDYKETLLHDLLARVAKLEAQAGNLKGSLTSSTPPPVATDEELDDTWHKTTGGTFLARRRPLRCCNANPAYL